MNKEEKSIGFGWWIVFFALPIFLTAIWVMANEHEKLVKVIPVLFIIFGVFLLGIFGPLNKKLKPSRNRNLAYQVIKIQVIAGGSGMPILATIAGQFPYERMLYLGVMTVMIFAVVYMFFINRKSN